MVVAKRAVEAYRQAPPMPPPVPGMEALGAAGIGGAAPAGMPPGMPPMGTGPMASAAPPMLAAPPMPMGMPPPQTAVPPGGGDAMGAVGGAGPLPPTAPAPLPQFRHGGVYRYAAGGTIPTPSRSIPELSQGGSRDIPNESGMVPGGFPERSGNTDLDLLGANPRELKARAPIDLLPGVLSAEQIVQAIARKVSGMPVDPTEYTDAPAPPTGDAEAALASIREEFPDAPPKFVAWLDTLNPDTTDEVERDFIQAREAAPGSEGVLWEVAKGMVQENDPDTPEDLIAVVQGRGKAKPSRKEPIEGKATLVAPKVPGAA